MSRLKIRLIDLMAVAAIIGYAGYMAGSRPADTPEEDQSFARQVDLSPLNKTAVQYDGRVRSFESHARALVGLISGSRKVDDQSFGFTYLDLIFRPETYADRDIIYIKNKLVRAKIGDVLRSQDTPQAEIDRLVKTGMVSKRLLETPAVRSLRQDLSRDLIRTARDANAINNAIGVSDGSFLVAVLRMVPPDGAVDEQWVSMRDLSGPAAMPQDAAHAGIGNRVSGIGEAKQAEIRKAWADLRQAWRSEDLPATNAQVAALASAVKSGNVEAYPSEKRLALESWYFRNNSMTWVWLVYLLSVLPLLMSLVYKWDGARKVGMVMFVIAFALHTASLIIRWYISGRWPNSNMFEAVTTSAWFGGVGAVILEWLTRRTPFRNLFALGSAVMSMVALMACHFLPASVDSAIRNKMAALNDIWLYIHTNVIIWSYAVIGLACVPALLLLRHRWCNCWDQHTIPKARLFMLPVALGVLNLTAWKLTMAIINPELYGMTQQSAIAYSGMFVGSMIVVLLEALAARDRAKAGYRVERSASGGASALLDSGPGSVTGKSNATQIFDGATMVLVEVAFIMLWTGTVMGAIWADHSWGRPWGWDPKEVFALNTFIIFIILIHVRFKVRDKAFWTAILAVIGFEVMLFNWIVVNFVITGLHSYA